MALPHYVSATFRSSARQHFCARSMKWREATGTARSSWPEPRRHAEKSTQRLFLISLNSSSATATARRSATCER